MIYSNKRHRVQDNSSNKEKLIFILGLIAVCGILGGLSALVYGLVKPSRSGLIGGSVVAGSSACLGVLLVVMYWCCITKSQKNKQKKSQQPSSNRREYQQRSTHSESTSSHQIHSISAATQQQTRHNQGYAVGQQSYGQSTYYPSNKSAAVINLNQSQSSTKSQIHSTNRHVRYP